MNNMTILCVEIRPEHVVPALGAICHAKTSHTSLQRLNER